MRKTVPMNKKGIATEAPKFTTDQLAILILFVILLAVLLILIIPRVSSGDFSDTISNFGKNIFDFLSGGRE